MWSIVNSTGMLAHLIIKAYYALTSQVRLLSTSVILHHHHNETITHDHDSLILSGVAGDRNRNVIEVDLHPTSYLLISTT